MDQVFAKFQAHVEDVARQAAEDAVQAKIDELFEKKNQRKNLVSGKEAAKYLGISIDTLTRRRNEGNIPGYRVGRKILYDLQEIENSLQSTRRA